MDILFLLIPLAFLLGLGFTLVFIWSVKDGQYDDLDTPAKRILFEDEQIVNNQGELN